MASVNTTSIREEIAKVEQDIEQLGSGRTGSVWPWHQGLCAEPADHSDGVIEQNSKITKDVDRSGNIRSPLLKYIVQLHQALEVWEQEAIEQLLAAPVMHVDETSLKLDKKNHWLYVCSAGDITLKRLHPKQGCYAPTSNALNFAVGSTNCPMYLEPRFLRLTE